MTQHLYLNEKNNKIFSDTFMKTSKKNYGKIIK